WLDFSMCRPAAASHLPPTLRRIFAGPVVASAGVPDRVRPRPLRLRPLQGKYLRPGYGVDTIAMTRTTRPAYRAVGEVAAGAAGACSTDAATALSPGGGASGADATGAAGGGVPWKRRTTRWKIS